MSAVDAPKVASRAVNRTDRRNREKLRRSPGSYFVGRARELVLAAPYFLRNLGGGAYGGTASAHFHNLCGAAYVAMLSAFEVMWKALFAAVVDTTDVYDDRLVADSRLKDVVKTESLLAHREESSAGGVLAASLGTWQQSEFVNRIYEAAFQVQPIAANEMEVVDQLWQIRHVVAHGAGVASRLDSYRLRGIVEAGASLQIDERYLKYAERELVKVTRGGIARVGDRLLQDFFLRAATRNWEVDAAVFKRLKLLGTVVKKTQELPEVVEADYDAAQAPYATP